MNKVSTMDLGNSLRVKKSFLENSSLATNMVKGNLSTMKLESLTKEVISMVSKKA